MLRSKLEGNPEEELRIRPSNEYGAGIIHSLETGTRIRPIPPLSMGMFQIRWKQLITNLPEGCCVEVPCTVDDQESTHTVGSSSYDGSNLSP